MSAGPRLHIAILHRDLHALTRGGICALCRALVDALAERGHSTTLDLGVLT